MFSSPGTALELRGRSAIFSPPPKQVQQATDARDGSKALPYQKQIVSDGAPATKSSPQDLYCHPNLPSSGKTSVVPPPLYKMPSNSFANQGAFLASQRANGVQQVRLLWV